ncbi:MAG: para-aminobenzoate synthetase/4-amino-4-deoxychorismate lyase [Planctomycetota bacterium]|jgi:para-aminobenzoate synthetase/4-amino-4-deoxychorismate lyase
MTIWVDGKLLGGNDVPRSKVTAPFETMGAIAGTVPLWGQHLQRLATTAERLGLAFTATPELRAAASEVMLTNGHTDDVLRLSLVPDSDVPGSLVRVVVASRKRSPIKSVRLLPTVVEREPDLPPADVKAEPRRFYDAVLQQAQDGEADDGIVVAPDGCLLEAALGNLWLRVDGSWRTPPLDGRVLPGIARAVLLERAAASGLSVEESPLTFADLHRAEAIAHSNAVYGPRPACLVGERAAVEIVDTELGTLWRQATSR